MNLRYGKEGRGRPDRWNVPRKPHRPRRSGRRPGSSRTGTPGSDRRAPVGADQGQQTKCRGSPEMIGALAPNAIAARRGHGRRPSAEGREFPRPRKPGSTTRRPLFPGRAGRLPAGDWRRVPANPASMAQVTSPLVRGEARPREGIGGGIGRPAGENSRPAGESSALRHRFSAPSDLLDLAMPNSMAPGSGLGGQRQRRRSGRSSARAGRARMGRGRHPGFPERPPQVQSESMVHDLRGRCLSLARRASRPPSGRVLCGSCARSSGRERVDRPRS